ncbi:MAG: 30S ribosome-binding factor RbfA [Planctomycetota bacterium]|nr:MAG: 30S ribosome-binding factor RbfA [Planctomycetota bacterium]
MPSASRKDRLESLLKREIASCIHSQLRDPRLGFLTVTRVELSGDLQQVTCYYTVLGSDKDRSLALHALRSAKGRITAAYAPVVRTRLLPRLRFAYDDVEDRRQRMDDLIRQARESDPHPDNGPEQPEQPEGDAEA